MVVKFYNLSKRTNSTKQPTGAGVEHSCVLKSASGILDPVIELQLPITSAPRWNYAYISDYGRYYWVTDAVFRDRLWELSLKVDPLASFKSSIGGSSLYVLRASAEKDGSISDMMYPLKSTYTVEAGSILQTPWWTLAPGVTSGYFVIGIMGRITDAGQAGGITYLVMGPSQFKTFTEKLFADDLSYYVGGGAIGISDTLAKMIFNPAEYINSVTWVPGEPGNTTVAQNGWHVGWWSYDQAVKTLNPASRLTYSASLSFSDHPLAATRGNYMNAEPFTQRWVFLPRVGYVTLDTNYLADKSGIDVTLEVDPITGAGIYAIFPSGGGAPLDRIGCQIGVPVQLAQTGISFTEAWSSVENSISGSVSAALNPGTFAGSVTSLDSAISSIASILAPHITKTGTQGGYLGLVGAGSPIMLSVFRDVADDDNAENGRPLCAVRQINNLSGYVKVMHGDVSDGNATEMELDAIRASLESGMFYE